MRVLAAVLVVLAVLVLWDAVWWLLRGVRPMSPWGLRRALRRPSPPTVLDVRTPAEYALFHIPGAVNLPYPFTSEALAATLDDPARLVVVVCMTGHRSPPAVQHLRRDGFRDVKNLTWGMSAWKLTGGETRSGK
ncbi:Rhodanese domain protein [Pseudodesulfovibrio mercurii]|uniref:Rhodanese domain protein n=1 Tax=Pseudodesulfovibrio mercurii TaxID=641491 RepID=F0JCM1_9BACT|nr:rhodanese-like domain-containing protein [Pseudodesulfovibrio mercurii]EGB15701.1 Rhodanese domain protein [Pseudodesulfovibrio mercurii]